MALDSDRDDDRTADDTTHPPAMGGKGQRQAAPPTDDDEPDDVAERIKAATAKANREAKDYRLKAKQLEERLAEIEAAQQEAADATLPEIDKLTKRVQAREAELAEAKADAEAIADAYDALQLRFAAYQESDGKVRPERREAVLKLLDLDAIDRDDDGKPVGLGKAIDAVLKEYPEFAAAQRGAGTPPPPVHGGTPPRRPSGANGAGGNAVDRATEQLIQSGKYQRA